MSMLRLFCALITFLTIVLGYTVTGFCLEETSQLCRGCGFGNEEYSSPIFTINGKALHTAGKDSSRPKSKQTMKFSKYAADLQHGDFAEYKGLNTPPLDAETHSPVRMSYGKLPLYFVQNNGQMDKRVKFYEKGIGHTMLFSEEGVYLSLTGSNGLNKESSASQRKTQDKSEISNSYATGEHGQTAFTSTTRSAFISLIPIGANKHPEIFADGLSMGKVNYLTGNKKTNWITNVPTYSAVVYKEIYDGIDIKFYGNNRQLEYDIIVKPGADPTQARFAYAGIEDLRVNENGDMEIIVKKGAEDSSNVLNTEVKIIQKRPYVYQEINGKRTEIEGRFEVETSKQTQGGADKFCLAVYPADNDAQKDSQQSGSNTLNQSGDHKSEIAHLTYCYSIKVASYDTSHSLIIDPILEYSTYIGGANMDDVGRGIAVDSSGAAYITGYTASDDFPVVGTDTPFHGPAETYDAFVTKLGTDSPLGLGLIYSTYIGGNDDDYSYGIAVDGSGSAYITGYTESSDFPVVETETDIGDWPLIASTLRGTRDAFVVKLGASGDTLEYSTYIGGAGNWDTAHGIAVNGDGYAYITGYTDSANFPVLGTDTEKNGVENYDAFVTKLSAETPVELVYSTYLGGSSDDQGYAIAVDGYGSAYIAGETLSSDFPVVGTTAGIEGEASDAFAAKLNASGDTLEYSTYIGGASADFARGIAVDSDGYAYITGYTESENFPIVGTNTPYGGGSYDAFIIKIGTGTPVEFIYSTYLGGSGEDQGHAIALDGSGSAYITGYTFSSEFPVVGTTTVAPHAAESCSAFISKLEPSGGSLAYSTYIGGVDNDYGYGIAVDASGDAHITGETYSSTFPIAGTTTGWSVDDFSNAFIVKVAVVSEEPPVTPPSEEPLPVVTLSVTSVSPSNGASGITVTTTVTATFSLTMNGSTLTADTFSISGGGGNVSGVVSTNGSTATFTPSENLDYDATYTATITTGAQAANWAGTTLSSSYSWSFTTESAPVQIPTPSPSPLPTIVPKPTFTGTITPTPTPVPSPSVTSATPKPFPSPTPSPLPSPTPIQGSTGSLSLSKERAYLSGDTVVVTVADSDRNADAASEDVLTTAIKIFGVNYYSGDDLLLDLKEEGADSGTFLATIRTGTTTTVGAGLGERTNIGVIKTVQGGTATVTYTDTAPLDTEVSEELTFSSFDAKLAFNNDKCLPDTFIGIILADAEQNINHVEAETFNDSVFVQTSRFNTTKVRMDETGKDTGIFTGSVLVARSGGTLEFNSIQGGVGDTLMALYLDDINTTGAVKLVTATVSVIDVAAPTPYPSIIATPSIPPTPYACTGEDIEISPHRLKLEKNESGDVTVIVTGKDGCLVNEESIRVKINKSGQKRITVSPKKVRTDSQGEAIFTINALNKKGTARVRFYSETLKKTLKVKVNK